MHPAAWAESRSERTSPIPTYVAVHEVTLVIGVTNAKSEGTSRVIKLVAVEGSFGG